jgi:predicted phosphoribosyltransferase
VTFADLHDAGRILADSLQHHRSDRHAIVLGIVRGGVPVAFEVARALGLPLDLVLRRTLLQDPSGDSIRAVRVAGTLISHPDLERVARSSGTVEAGFLRDAIEDLTQREAMCRGTRPAPDLAGRTVLLVDNGVRTGKTMRASIQALRSVAPARIVAAVPVGSAEAVRAVGSFADEMICLATPDPFGHVGMYYRRFAVPNEKEIGRLLDECNGDR